MGNCYDPYNDISKIVNFTDVTEDYSDPCYITVAEIDVRSAIDFACGSEYTAYLSENVTEKDGFLGDGYSYNSDLIPETDIADISGACGC